MTKRISILIAAATLGGCVATARYQHEDANGEPVGPELRFVQFSTLENAAWFVLDADGEIIAEGSAGGLGNALVGAGGYVGGQAARRPDNIDVNQNGGGASAGAASGSLSSSDATATTKQNQGQAQHQGGED